MEPELTQDTFEQSAQVGDTDLSVDDAASALGFSTTLADTMLQPMLDAENMPVEDEANPTGEEETQGMDLPMDEETEEQSKEVEDEVEEEPEIDPEELKKEVKKEVMTEVDSLKDEIKSLKEELKNITKDIRDALTEE